MMREERRVGAGCRVARYTVLKRGQDCGSTVAIWAIRDRRGRSQRASAERSPCVEGLRLPKFRGGMDGSISVRFARRAR